MEQSQVCEIQVTDSRAGATFSFKTGDRLVVGADIHEDEAVRWVNGGGARVSKGSLPGVEQGVNGAVRRLIGSPEPAIEDKVEVRSLKARRG